MQCPSQNGKDIEVVLAHLSGRLSPDEAEAFRSHAESCAACQDAMLAQQVVSDAMDGWEPEPISANFDQQLFGRIEQEESKKWWSRLFRPLWPMRLRPAVAAAAVALVIAAVVLLRVPGNVSTPPVAAVEPVDIEQIEQTLQDLEMLNVLDPELSEEVEPSQVPPEEGEGMVWLSGAPRCG